MSSDGERGQSAYRSLRILGKLAKVAVGRGGKAAAMVNKTNVALAAMDAAVSVLDACTSFMRHESAREQTAQLAAKLESERTALLAARHQVELQVQLVEQQSLLRRENREVLASALRLVGDLLDEVERMRAILESNEETNLERLRMVDFRYERASQMYRKANQLLDPEKEMPPNATQTPQT